MRLLRGCVAACAIGVCLASREVGPVSGESCEAVVLLHGLNRTPRAMEKLERALRGEGYRVVNCGYPSRTADIGTLAESVFAELRPKLKDAPSVHFVTHSMGGVLLRFYLRDHVFPRLGRVVMLGPPNRGSEIVDRLGGLRLFRWVNGPAGCQLGTGEGSLPLSLGPPDFDLGVIAGDRSVNPVLSMLIPGRDDGKVAVARTRVEGMSDFLCLHVTHSFMMRNACVIRQTRHFLRFGHFSKNNGGHLTATQQKGVP